MNKTGSIANLHSGTVLLVHRGKGKLIQAASLTGAGFKTGGKKPGRHPKSLIVGRKLENRGGKTKHTSIKTAETLAARFKQRGMLVDLETRWGRRTSVRRNYYDEVVRDLPRRRREG